MKSNLVSSGTMRRRRTGFLSLAPQASDRHALRTPPARHNVSMTRIESRPSKNRLWEYVFFIDVEGHQRDAVVAQALAELKERAPFLKILGSYPVAVN